MLQSIHELKISTRPPAELLMDACRFVTEHLQADRCFLYLRHPDQNLGKIAFCWLREDSIPDVTEPEWRPDLSIAQEDPLFAAALHGKPPVFVEDVEKAPPHVLNRGFEARTFGHRSLIHAHLVENGRLWGILQPCLFGQPRTWTDADHTFISDIVPPLLPLAKAFVHEVFRPGQD